MRGSWFSKIAALAFIAVPAWTDEPTASVDSSPRDEPAMEVIVVTGEQTGPGLWKVTSGGHVMWILGEISPYPRSVKWKSKEFDVLLRNSQELIIDFSGYWKMDLADNLAYARASKLPQGTTLKDVISPDLLARVEATATIYGASDLDGLYPFSVTNRLVSSAMEKLDMVGFSARFSADELGRRRHVVVTHFAAPEPPFAIRLNNWQHASNATCLQRLVEAIEDGGRGVRRLANAWSVGDIEALRRLVPAYSFSRDGFRTAECATAMRGGEQQLREYNQRRTQAWLDRAERALRRNRSTIAVVLMSEIFAADGYLAGLRDRGYEIAEPE